MEIRITLSPLYIRYMRKQLPAKGRFIHTYKCDGNPLPSFEGEPKLVDIPDDIEAFTELLWNSLNEDNKVSLFVRYIDIATGTYDNKDRKQKPLRTEQTEDE